MLGKSSTTKLTTSLDHKSSNYYWVDGEFINPFLNQIMAKREESLGVETPVSNKRLQRQGTKVCKGFEIAAVSMSDVQHSLLV